MTSYKRTLAIVLLGMLVFVPGLRAGEGLANLSEEARKVYDYLLKDWSERMHSTSIPLAMRNLKIPENDSLRLELGGYFRENTDAARNIRAWGANNYILSNEEKRIAKFLIGHWEEKQAMPEKAVAAKELGLDLEKLDSRLAFLARAGLLEGREGAYRLTTRYSRWGGPLRFNYHTISIGGKDPFDVW